MVAAHLQILLVDRRMSLTVPRGWKITQTSLVHKRAENLTVVDCSKALREKDATQKRYTR